MKKVTLGRFAFQYRSKAEWEASQLILYAGELAVEGDTGLMKVGDGKHLYSELPYFNRGEKGDTGEKGEKGETGAALAIKGTKNSTTDLPKTGQAGDAYMIGGDLYVWSDTTWTNVGRVKGEVGQTGPQGPMGPRGPQGPTGAKGEKGDQGEQGPRGFTGEQGANGIQGPKGETGPRGEKGDKGEKGDALRWKDLTEAQKKELAPDLTPYVTKEKHEENLNYVMNEVDVAKKFFEEQTATIDTALAQVAQDLDNEKLNKSDVINDLTTGGTDKALSAEMGKTINQSINALGEKEEVKHVSGDGYKAYKCGNIVTLYLYPYIPSGSYYDQSVSIQLPDGYAPSFEIHEFVPRWDINGKNDSSCEIFISPEGHVYVRSFYKEEYVKRTYTYIAKPNA